MKRILKSLLSVLLSLGLAVGILYQGAPVKADSYPYLISVNKQMNTMTIYGKNKKGEYKVPVKAFVVSTGYATPIGNFKIEIQYRWKELIGGAWGQYCSRVTWDGIIIHSVWYYGPYAERQNSSKFNMLGTTNSNGCINLTVQDCKWIYDNCPVGTPIRIYNSSNPGPLGKPKMLKVPYSSGYDPTDRWTKGNPYNGKKPVIKGVKNRKVKYGEDFDIMKGVSAKNTTGYDATSLVTTTVKFAGKEVKRVNTKKAGIYKVTYAITDEIGRKAKEKAVITVVDNVKPVLKNVKNREVEAGTKINKETVLKGVTAKWHSTDLTKDIEVEIEETGEGRYKVTYTVKAPNGKQAKQKCIFTVLPGEEEEGLRFEGIEDKVLGFGSEVTTASALEGVRAYDGDNVISGDAINVVIDKLDSEEDYDIYKVTYTIENDINHLSEEAFIKVKRKE